MSKVKKPRVNKSKKEIAYNIAQVHEAERLRKIVKEQLFPFLIQLNETLGYTKIFLQVAAVTADNVFNATSKEVKVKDLMPKFIELYKKDEGHNKMYIKLFEMFAEESVSTFVSLIQMTPEKIEKYFTQETDKRPIVDVNIDAILG